MKRITKIQDVNLNRIPRTLKKLSVTLAALLAFMPPISYLVISYQYELNELKVNSELISHSISKLAYLHPDEWDLSVHTLEQLIEEYRPRDFETNIRILDHSGSSILSQLQHPFKMKTSSQSSILSVSGQVGILYIERSLWPKIYQSFLIGLLSLLFAFIFLGAINRYAIRGIRQAAFEINQAQKNIQKKSLYLDGILSSSEHVAIIATNENGLIQYYNTAAETLFSRTVSEVLGTSIYQLHDDLGSHITKNLLGKLNAKKREYQFQMLWEHHGEERHIEVRVSNIYKPDYGLSGYTLMCTDITAQFRASELIQYQASYDSLTDLPNRRLFKDELIKALANAKRHHHLGAVLFLDLDNFKNMNDSLGHSYGDLLLQTVATRLKSCLRVEDTVARLGGDEFVILISELSDEFEEAISYVQVFSNKILETFNAPIVLDLKTLYVTTSIGIAIFPTDAQEYDDIMRQADTAMYRAKESGRNTLTFFHPNMQKVADQVYSN